MFRQSLPTTLVVAAAYIAASELVLRYLRVAGDAPILWLASGVALAALLLRDARALPGVALGALACALLGGGSPWMAVPVAALTTAQIVLGWWLLTRVVKLDATLARVQDVVALVAIGAGVSPLVNAARSIIAAYWRGKSGDADALAFIKVVTLGEFTGLLVLVPVILAWLHPAASRTPPARVREAWLLHAVSVAVSVTVFGGFLAPAMNADSLPYVLFPITFWAAFRLGVRDTATVLLVAGAIAVTCHARGVGPFVMSRSVPDDMFSHFASLYLFLAVLAITSLLVAAAQRQRESAESKVRESEARYRTLIERMNEGVNLTDADAKLVFVSDRFCEMTGYSREELIGKTGKALTVPEMHEDWAESHRKRREGKSESHPLIMRRKDGELLHLWVSPRPQFDEKGAYLGSLNVVLDVSDRRRAEEKARAHLDQLAHVSRVASMGEMASAIAHEINQPLTAIANYASASLRLMKAGKLSEGEALDTMQRLAAEAERAGEIVRRMRGFVRGEEGCLEPVAVDGLLADVARLAGPEARQFEVELVVEPCGGLPPVLADAIQIQQVLINLVRNGVEAIAGADSPERRVTLAARAADAARIEITVRDTGPGLPEDALERVFEPFYTTKPEGIGIGLALSRSIVDAHGGRLAASAGAPGAVFHLTLPIASEAAHASP